jgi:ribosomal protein L33
MAKKSSKKSLAYRLINEETGSHYVVRLGREGFDKLKERSISKFDPKLGKHAKFKVRKLKK